MKGFKELRKWKSLPYLFYRSKKSVESGQTSLDDASIKETSRNNDTKVTTTKHSFQIYEMRGVDKKYLSCNNLMTVNNSLKNNQNNSVKNTPTMKRALSIRRPKSLQRLHEEFKPLLDAASSLSSIGSYNELTEESVLESSYSDDSRTHEVNNVVLRPGGKLRSLKHRPRSSAFADRNLGSIPENILSNNLRKRHAIYIKSLNNINQIETTGIENLTLMDIDIGEKQNYKSQSLVDRNRHNRLNTNNDISNNNISVKSISLQNIAIPRRRSKPKIMTEAVSTTSISEQSFSKEQKRRLKKKMKDTQKSPENSVFLGLF